MTSPHALSIRVMHSMIRRRVGQQPSWDSERRGWTRCFLTEETFTANQLPLPCRQPLSRVASTMHDEPARRVVPGYQSRLDARKRRERSVWLQRHAGARRARFGAVESLAR